MKRHNFSGGKASHGDQLEENQEAISFMRSQGKVIKGKTIAWSYGCNS